MRGYRSPIVEKLRNGLIAVFAAVAGLAGASAASAQAPLATLTAASPIGAGQGWVVWSQAGTRGWSLFGSHDGVSERLPVDDGGSMLDVDIGTDAHGSAVATYSRCKDWYAYRNTTDATGCETRVLDLATGQERAIGIRRLAWQSDTTPSM